MNKKFAFALLLTGAAIVLPGCGKKHKKDEVIEKVETKRSREVVEKK